ncbi:glycoside hydrolase family 19 protein, partial [Serratia sp. NPDC071084]
QEYLSAIHNPSYRDVKNKMIVKHPSEWYHKKDTSIWQSFLNKLTNDAPEWKAYSEAYIEKMVWMQDATKLKLGPSLWHMHPVMFLGAIEAKKQVNITVDMLYELFEGLRAPNKKDFLQQFAGEINDNAEKYKLDTLRRVNHFFAQVREEMGGGASPVEGLNYSEEGLKANFKYFRVHPDEARKYSYKKSGGRIITRANEVAIANRVYANRLGNGNVSSGDGSKYCGRGGVHLTGKENYRGFSDYYKTQWGDGADFINNPSLLESPVYCVRSAVYFWLREELYSIADTGDTGSVVDKITSKINLHTDSYAKRRKHFEKIMNKKIFLEAFQ